MLFLVFKVPEVLHLSSKWKNVAQDNERMQVFVVSCYLQQRNATVTEGREGICRATLKTVSVPQASAESAPHGKELRAHPGKRTAVGGGEKIR